MISNTNYSTDPTINPLNSNNSIFKGFYRHSPNATLPDPVPYGMQTNDDLHVPQAAERPPTLADIQCVLDGYAHNKTWNNSEIYSLPDSPNHLSKADEQYWQRIRQEQELADKNMTPEERAKRDAMLKTLEAGGYFPKPNFIDESRKVQ